MTDSLPISRAAAIQAGAAKYFTGRPCKYGHVSARSTSHGGCNGCWGNTGHPKAAQRRAAKKRHYYEHPLAKQLRNAKSRSKTEGRPFNIALEDIHIPDHCPCCGVRMTFAPTGVSFALPTTPSFDRLIPNNGYVAGNVSVICWGCNRIKSDATLLDLERIVSWMKKQMAEQESPVRHLKVVSQGV